MRIIQVNKFHYPRGGAEKYFLDLSSALKKAGHEVAVFSMQHPKNEPSSEDKYFVSRLSFNEGNLKDKLKAPGRIIYSLEAKKNFTKLVLDFKPDIIHLHNIYHQISPSILTVAKKYKVPVVMHVHDYKLLCPNYQLFADGAPCEACKPNKYYHCLQKRCFKNSLSQSALATLEMYIHHNLLKIYEKNIQTFIAPSNFMKQKMLDFNWPEKNIKVIINPFSSAISAEAEEIEKAKNQNYLLFFGRLSKEKNLQTLIKAANLTNTPLKIVGIGEEKDALEKETKLFKAQVEFLGYKKGRELKEIILNAKAVVIPSICYENMPLSMLEALSLGKIVIASKIGGMPEIIKEGENGFLFAPGNYEELASKIKLLDQTDLIKMRTNAYQSVKNLSPENNLQQVINVYKNILNLK